jgi:ankyrin repeat protein
MKFFLREATESGYKNTALLLINECNWDDLPFVEPTTRFNINETLVCSCQNSKLEEISLLLLDKLGPKFNFQTDTPSNALIHACALKTETVALALLNSNLNVSLITKNRNGQDPLTFSLENGHRNIIDILMENNFDLNRPSKLF